MTISPLSVSIVTRYIACSSISNAGTVAIGDSSGLGGGWRGVGACRHGLGQDLLDLGREVALVVRRKVPLELAFGRTRLVLAAVQDHPLEEVGVGIVGVGGNGRVDALQRL